MDSGPAPASHRSAVQVAQQPGSDGLRLQELESKLFQDIRLVAEDIGLQKGYADSLLAFKKFFLFFKVVEVQGLVPRNPAPSFRLQLFLAAHLRAGSRSDHGVPQLPQAQLHFLFVLRRLEVHARMGLQIRVRLCIRHHSAQMRDHAVDEGLAAREAQVRQV